MKWVEKWVAHTVQGLSNLVQKIQGEELREELYYVKLEAPKKNVRDKIMMQNGGLWEKRDWRRCYQGRQKNRRRRSNR
jgi:hypothetical protein